MKKMQLIVASVILGGILIGAPVRALAQNDPRDVVIASLQLDQADIRDALKILFRNVGVSYSVDSNVQGTITCDLKNIPFETALRSVLSQVNATYRIEGGVYYIVLKKSESERPGGETTDTAPTKAENPTRRLHIRSADPALIFTLLSSSMRTDTQLQPEMSTLIGGGFGGGGFGGGQGGFGQGGFGQGGFGQGGGGFGGGGFGGGGFGGGGFGGGGGQMGRPGGGGGGRGF